MQTVLSSLVVCSFLLTLPWRNLKAGAPGVGSRRTQRTIISVCVQCIKRSSKPQQTLHWVIAVLTHGFGMLPSKVVVIPNFLSLRVSLAAAFALRFFGLQLIFCRHAELGRPLDSSASANVPSMTIGRSCSPTLSIAPLAWGARRSLLDCLACTLPFTRSTNVKQLVLTKNLWSANCCALSGTVMSMQLLAQ